MEDSMNNAGPEVKLFALLSWSHCKETKRFLKDNNINSNVVHVDLLTGDERSQVMLGTQTAESEVFISYDCHWQRGHRRVQEG
jgi:hypothetical protein